jgi:sugar lactone lactonase YvrE
MRQSVFRQLRTSVVLFTACLSTGSSANAQAWSGIPSVDSASVARAAWARAGLALRSGDRSAARREVAHAASAWPMQPSYLWAVAVLAAQARDTAAALDGLRRYTALGLGRDLRADSALADIARAATFAEVREVNAANARPLARSRVERTFGDSTFWAEGVDADPVTGHLYVASIRHRTIADVSPNGAARELWPPDQYVFGAMFGVRVDTARHVLWATTSGVPQQHGYIAADSSIAALLEIRPADGTVIHRFDLPPVRGGHVLGDLAIGPHGDVFTTDSNQPFLYRLRPGADSLEAITSPLFRSLQGMAPTPDGRVLYVADYSHGLLRVDLLTRVVSRVEDAPGSTSAGCDGIVLNHGAIIAVQNGVTPPRIVRFSLDSSGARVRAAEVIDRNFTVADEPAIGTVLGGNFVYVANGQWEKFDDTGRRLPAGVLSPTILLAVPLPR